MATKITLDDINGGYSLTKINSNFQKIEDELNEKVLYRANPGTETNTMTHDLDMNGHSLINVHTLQVSDNLVIGGIDLQAEIVKAQTAATAADVSKTAAQLAEVNAEAAQAISETKAAEAAASAASVDASNIVHKTGDETIGGVKTFSTSPILPTPAVGDNTTTAATTAYVKAEIAADTGVVHRTGAESIAGVKTFTDDTVVKSLNGGQLAGVRNKVINGNFSINQRAVSGTVVLSAGAYGHDRWRAGASGCTYTFSTSNNITVLTITAGSLQQEIEGNNLQSGSHILSWAGTSQGRIDGGAYGVTGRTATLTGGTNSVVEFSTGTVSKVQLEEGGSSTPFEHRPIGMELALCQRYYEVSNLTYYWYGQCTSGNVYAFSIGFLVPKRVTPTMSIVNGTVSQFGTPSASGSSSDGFLLAATASATHARGIFGASYAASAEL